MQDYKPTGLNTLSGIVLLTILISFSTPTFAQEWRSLTDMRSVNEMVYDGSLFWCATSGGLASFDPISEEFNYFNTIDGLSGIEINGISQGEDGELWITFANRTLQRFVPETGITHTITSLQTDLQSLNDIAVGESNVYVASDVGIAVVNYVEEFDRWVWFEEYSRLGQFSSNIPVTCLEVVADTLWAGTSEGIAKGVVSRSGTITWLNFTVSEGLPGNGVVDIAAETGFIAAATDAGVGLLEGGSWRRILGETNVIFLDYHLNDLYVLKRNGLLKWDGNNWTELGGFRKWASSVVIADGDIWTSSFRNALETGGLSRLTGDAWDKYTPNSIITNNVLDFAFSPGGNIAVVGGRGGGEYGLGYNSGAGWTLFALPSQQENIFSFQHRSLVYDLTGGIWTGTSGGGIANYRIDDEDNIDTVIVFDNTVETGSRLIGYSNSFLNYVLAPDLEVDGQGNVWVLNRGAANGNVLACIPADFVADPSPEKEWIYFHRSMFGNYPNLDLITIDELGRKWMATTVPNADPGRGIYVLDDNNTPRDTTDDVSYGPITAGLNSPQVLSIKWDPAGYIWVGSIDGAYYIDANIESPSNASFTRLFQLINWPVYAIEIDPASNKWFGTGFGVKIISDDLFTEVNTITDQAPDLLPSNTVNSIKIDVRTGWAYIGTDNGTAVLRTPYRQFQSVKQVVVAPNPFNPNRGSGRMEFLEGLAEDASATIYTPDGRLVKSLSHTSAAIGWDGTNENGSPVADGVYLILTYSSTGGAGQTKVAVIRK